MKFVKRVLYQSQWFTGGDLGSPDEVGVLADNGMVYRRVDGKLLGMPLSEVQALTAPKVGTEPPWDIKFRDSYENSRIGAIGVLDDRQQRLDALRAADAKIIADKKAQVAADWEAAQRRQWGGLPIYRDPALARQEEAQRKADEVRYKVKTQQVYRPLAGGVESYTTEAKLPRTAEERRDYLAAKQGLVPVQEGLLGGSRVVWEKFRA